MKLILLFVCLLAGCATAPVPRANILLTVQEIKVIEVPAGLITETTPTAPPSIAEYMAATKDGREDLIVRYVMKMIEEGRTAAIDKAAIRALLSEQKAAVLEFNQREAERIKTLQQEMKDRQ